MFIRKEAGKKTGEKGRSAASCRDEIVYKVMIRHCKVGLAVLLSLSALSAEEIPGIDSDRQARLEAGEHVILEKRPDETDKTDHRFVTVAAIVAGPRKIIWEVINDKENAATFLEGVLESKVIEREGNRILVEQLTHVGGPRGSYRYRLWHELTPMTRADFTYAGGELRNVLGTWWIYDGPDEERCIVVYSLHIDPGLLAPQPVVKAGMRKTMPKTIQSIAKEVAKRK